MTDEDRAREIVALEADYLDRKAAHHLVKEIAAALADVRRAAEALVETEPSNPCGIIDRCPTPRPLGETYETCPKCGRRPQVRMVKLEPPRFEEEP